MTNYLNSKVYKLVSNLTADIYIGSCVVELSKRLSHHKLSSNQCVSKKMFVNDAIITIVLLEAYPCNSKNELKARELYYITNNVCINHNKPFITELLLSDKEYMKEYSLANAAKIGERMAKYYLDNADKIKEYNAKYYLDNVDKVKANKAKYYLDNTDKIKEYNAKYRLEQKLKKLSI